MKLRLKLGDAVVVTDFDGSKVRGKFVFFEMSGYAGVEGDNGTFYFRIIDDMEIPKFTEPRHMHSLDDFHVGQRVFHVMEGWGTVTQITKGVVYVRFDSCETYCSPIPCNIDRLTPVIT